MPVLGEPAYFLQYAAPQDMKDRNLNPWTLGSYLQGLGGYYPNGKSKPAATHYKYWKLKVLSIDEAPTSRIPTTGGRRDIDICRWGCRNS